MRSPVFSIDISRYLLISIFSGVVGDLHEYQNPVKSRDSSMERKSITSLAQFSAASAVDRIAGSISEFSFVIGTSSLISGCDDAALYRDRPKGLSNARYKNISATR